jgi:hypothetical protein
MSKSALIIITVTVWLIVCLSFELHRISALLALPPSGDLYAHTWSFQLMMFAIFRLPLWLIGLLVVFAAEFALLTRRTSRA